MMNGKWTLPLAALAFSLTVTPFSAFAAKEDVPPPPPGERQGPGAENRLPRPERERRGPGMPEEQRLKLEELDRKVGEALEAYRAEPNDTTKAALKARIAERFELQQKFAIERAEKMLAREKERLENKDQEVDRQLERMLRPRREKPQGPPRGERMRRADHRQPDGPGRPEGERPEPGRRGIAGARGAFGRALTPEEGRRTREIMRELLKADAVTPEVTAQIESLRTVYETALERQTKALEAAKSAPEGGENGKNIEALERSIRFLSRNVESMKQPENYFKQLKRRAERRRGPGDADRPEKKK